MTEKRSPVGTVAWLTGEKLARLLIGLALGAQIARLMGPETYGGFSYLLTLLSFFAVAAPLGTDPIAIREIASNSVSPKAALGTLLILRLFSALLTCLLMIVWVAVEAPKNLLLPGVLASVTLLFSVGDVLETLLQATGNAGSAARARIGAMLTSAIIKSIFIINNCGVIHFAFAQAIETAIAASLLWFAAKNKGITQTTPFDHKLAQRLLKEAWPLLLSGLAVACYMRLDQLIILKYLGPKEVGIYNAASTLSTVWCIVPASVTTALAPQTAKIFSSSKVDFEASIKKLLGIFLIGSVLLSSFVTAISSHAVSILFGPAYQASGPILAILIWSNVFIYAGIAQSLWIVNEGKTALSLLKPIIGAAISIILNIILVPRWGLIACAVTAVITQLTVNFLLNAILFPRLFRIQLQSALSLGIR